MVMSVKKSGKEMPCKTCGKLVYRHPSAIGVRKYCSQICVHTDPEYISRKSELAKERFGSKETHIRWRGDQVGYGGVHQWLYKTLGKARECHHCGNPEAVKYEWANVSGKYLRTLEDWKQLCGSCHTLFDRAWLKNRTRDERGRFASTN